MPLSTFDAITLAIALVGAILGVINTWHAIDKRRVKIQVRPQQVTPYRDEFQEIDFRITVTNFSDFPITIKEVGFLYKGTDVRSVVLPQSFEGEKMPRRLEARTETTIFGQSASIRRDQFIVAAFAKTACGIIKKGSTPYLKALAQKLSGPLK